MRSSKSVILSEGIKKDLKQLNNEARESRKKIIELQKENLKLKSELDEYTTDIDSSWLMSSHEDNQGASSSQPAQGGHQQDDSSSQWEHNPIEEPPTKK